MSRLRGVALVAALIAAMTVVILATEVGTTDDGAGDSTPIAMTVASPVLLGTREPESIDEQTLNTPVLSDVSIPVPDNSAPDQLTPAPTPTISTPGQQPVEATATPTPVTPHVEAPIQLRIPALGIDTAVQWVGLDDQGRMDVPDNYTDVAWYEQGPRPGMPGNAVIAGHLDSPSGPAVFYKLEDLQPGDEIYVVTHDGEEVRFVVQELEVYDADDAPLARIFGSSDQPRLNLITCDGVFDRSSRTYDKRLVVYASADAA